MTRSKIISDEQLWLATRKVLLQRGGNLPVSAIAKELGVSPATMFFRAKTKNALLVRSLLPSAPSAIQEFEQGPDPDRDPREELTSILFGLCSHFPHSLPSLLLLRGAKLLPAHKPAEVRRPELLRRALSAWLRRSAANGAISVKDPRAAAELLVGALEARYFVAYVDRIRYSASQDRAFLRRILNQVLRFRSPSRSRR